MSLIRWREPEVWESFGGLLNLRNLSRYFGESFVPAADLVEDKDEVVLTMDVPGMKLEQFDISIADDVLTVKGERKFEREQQSGSAHRLERAYGSFQRSVLLPAAVDADRVKATYKDGVLEVRLPKTEAAKPKKIVVQGS